MKDALYLYSAKRPSLAVLEFDGFAQNFLPISSISLSVIGNPLRILLRRIAISATIKHYQVILSLTLNSLRTIDDTVFRTIWGHSSAGRAPAWHAGGQRFESAWLHLFLLVISSGLEDVFVKA